MYGLRAVTTPILSRTFCSHCSALAVMPSTQFRRRVFIPFISSSALSKQHCTITGSMAFNSICAASPLMVTQKSLPITLKHTWLITSGITGFTLPGIIEEPGWRAGRAISSRPQRGPEDRSRKSLLILLSFTARRFIAEL